MPAKGQTTPLLKRIWQYVLIDELDGCWSWLGAMEPRGYGRVHVDPRVRGSNPHREMYRLLKGDPPKGLVLDHLCRNKACVNPLHLEPVTIEENFRRGTTPTPWHRGKTHCKNGHEFNDENTVVRPGRRHRCCLICRRAYYRAYYYRPGLEERRKRASAQSNASYHRRKARGRAAEANQ